MVSKIDDRVTPQHSKLLSHSKIFWHRNVRNGEWFTWDKIRFSSLYAAVLLVFILTYLLLIPNAFTSPNGTFLIDYFSFWLAGQQAISGTPELVYNLAEFAALQNQVSESDTVFAFFYPPTFQLIQIPYALLPMKLAFLAFIGTTTLLLWCALRLIVGNWVWAAALTVIPASLNNAMHGQNAALTTALYALFLIGLERKKPVIAGIVLGILTIKPQLGMLIPFALIAGANWHCFTSATITTAVVAGLSLALLGESAWISFLQQIPVTSEVMHSNGVSWGKMISIYSSLRQLNIGHANSFSLQIISALAVLICVWITWRYCEKMSIRAAVLVAGGLLATPFALNYDLTLLIVPCAFLIRDGLKHGFLPYEKAALASFIVLSSSTASIALQFGTPIAPLLPLSILLLGMRRFIQSPDPVTLRNS
ncbi:hypothetical protein PsAD2_01022 [Pseudovibrio axinellae]|uniref:Polyprenol-phosphate-mannose-dependent alpha-(1-2)-phosphatidylinositol mannoside mannosyltransferase n=1 Tax=Pseudovibrio axinellae TaxID=989403 RepID=A0A166AG90_9HYPH|nr:glycosyltransferase family 87 protein [Pseudovibrio axinellae]KZL21030.1 hypothetical protein PsAD2_01022 [Pseudovibrio axinellae]SEP78275.1 Protein of unknown function [Pseudovibrio axinellae]